jgi:hypothetical protein
MALQALHNCESSFHLEGASPFCVETTDKLFTLSISDSHSMFITLSDEYTKVFNMYVEADKRRIQESLDKLNKKKLTPKLNSLEGRICTLCNILSISRDDVTIDKDNEYSYIKFKSDYIYSIKHMRLICTVFNKYKGRITCMNNQLTIIIKNIW